MQIECARLLLRDFETADVEAYASYHSDPRYLYYYAPEVGEPEHARSLVTSFVATACAVPRLDFTLAVAERVTAKLVGCISLRTAGHSRGQGEFGVELAPNAWGRGLAYEAAGALLRFGFDTLALDAVRAHSVTENRRLERLVARLGFRRVRDYDGDAWLRARGWSHTEWLLTRAAWTEAV